MTYVAVAIGGAALIGGGLSYLSSEDQSRAAQAAAGQQVLAQEQAMSQQWAMYQQQLQQQQPYVQSGQQGLQQLDYLMGMPGFTQQPQYQPQTYSQMLTAQASANSSANPPQQNTAQWTSGPPAQTGVASAAAANGSTSPSGSGNWWDAVQGGYGTPAPRASQGGMGIGPQMRPNQNQGMNPQWLMQLAANANGGR
jgi:hypothetical protein